MMVTGKIKTKMTMKLKVDRFCDPHAAHDLMMARVVLMMVVMLMTLRKSSRDCYHHCSHLNMTENGSYHCHAFPYSRRACCCHDNRASLLGCNLSSC